MKNGSDWDGIVVAAVSKSGIAGMRSNRQDTSGSEAKLKQGKF